MQEIKREDLIAKAAQLLADGTVDRVIGWKKGEFDYDVTPAVFTSKEELESEFVWNDFCGANFSKYLRKEADKTESKVMAFLKPCDTYSFNQLLTEHKFDREKVYVVGIPCNGMIDDSKIKESANGISSVSEENGKVVVDTLYDGKITLERADVLAERCANCKSKKHTAYDELLGKEGEVLDSARFDEVAKLEAMTADERFAFWQNELSRCIRFIRRKDVPHHPRIPCCRQMYRLRRMLKSMSSEHPSPPSQP